MFDLTREIHLEKKWQKKYAYLRILVFVVFFITALFVAHKILFPSASFDFFFKTPNATKNSIIKPRVPNGERFENGNIPSGEKLAFDTSLVGDFSQATINLKLTEKSPDQFKGDISIRKSYQAFFYPLTKPMGFLDGSLLRHNSNYFIVSDGSLRRFSSLEVALNLGFRQAAFAEIPELDLSLHPRGAELTGISKYPADSLFKIFDEYYQLKENMLLRFVSEKAYLSRYSPLQAIEKNSSFLDSYPVSEEYLGFLDGTLLSADISVYIVSGKNIYPINNPVTFESMGFLWSDVVSASSEEIGIYEQQKLYTLSSPHPPGTIFHTKDTGKYYYVQNETLREFVSIYALSSYPKANYIEVEEKSLDSSVSCEIKPRLKIFGLYTCNSNLNDIKNLLGNDYQFLVDLENPASIDTMNVNFSQVLTWENMIKSLASLKSRVTNNYIAK